jgi:hypothetical protein
MSFPPDRLIRWMLRRDLRKAPAERAEAYENSERWVMGAGHALQAIERARSTLRDLYLQELCQDLRRVDSDLFRAESRLLELLHLYDLRDEVVNLAFRDYADTASGKTRTEFSREWERELRSSLGLKDYASWKHSYDETQFKRPPL